MTGPEVLDRYFLEIRARLLEIGASLDRIDRAAFADEAGSDPRRKRIDEALELLRSRSPGRAEGIQRLFSRDYDPNWMDGFGPAERLAHQGS